jgi:hypothetical protein
MRYHEELEGDPSYQPEAGDPKQGETEDSNVTLYLNQPLSPWTFPKVITHPNDPADQEIIDICSLPSVFSHQLLDLLAGCCS